MNRAEILSTLGSSLRNLQPNNINQTVQTIITLPIKTVSLLDEVTYKLHCQITNSYHTSSLYAQLCSSLINDQQFNKGLNSRNSFQKILMTKCQNLFNKYKYYQEYLKNITVDFKHNKSMTPADLCSELCNFQCNFYNNWLTNCKFLAELYQCGGIKGKIILSYVTELSNLKKYEELHVHCLCITLKIAGEKLSKTSNMGLIVSQLVLLTKKTSIDMSPIIKSLVLEISNLYQLNWKTKVDDNNHANFNMLPFQSQNYYVLKSMEIMAESIYDECYEILFLFVRTANINKCLYLLTSTNTWLNYDQLSFAVSMILVGIINGKKVSAGKLLDNLIDKGWLSKNSVKLGVDKILNDMDFSECD